MPNIWSKSLNLWPGNLFGKEETKNTYKSKELHDYIRIKIDVNIFGYSPFLETWWFSTGMSKDNWKRPIYKEGLFHYVA